MTKEEYDKLDAFQQDAYDFHEEFFRKCDELYVDFVTSPVDHEYRKMILCPENTKYGKYKDWKVLRRIVDVVWGDAMEDGQVPSTEHADDLIYRALKRGNNGQEIHTRTN